VLLRLDAVRTASLTETPPASFPAARELADTTTHEVYLHSTEAAAQPSRLVVALHRSVGGTDPARPPCRGGESAPEPAAPPDAQRVEAAARARRLGASQRTTSSAAGPW
jgi:hypothetical protein